LGVFAVLMSACAAGGSSAPDPSTPQPAATSLRTDGDCQPDCGEAVRCGQPDGCGGTCVGTCGKPGYVCDLQASDQDDFGYAFVCRDSRAEGGNQ
jgi:hypothetical protein